MAPARRIAAGARGPPWRQKARLQAKEPHKLASGRMRRGANPDSVLHSDKILKKLPQFQHAGRSRTVVFWFPKPAPALAASQREFWPQMPRLAAADASFDPLVGN